jgi:RNA polymerase sigma-70 factor, ECF subfamily
MESESLREGEARTDLRAFVRQYSGQLLAIAARIVGREDAEDVAQEAFVSLVRRSKVSTLPEGRSLAKLMCRITVCRAYDHRRKKWRRKDTVTANGEVFDAPVDDGSTPRPLVSLEVEQLARAYDELPFVQRVAHVLYHYYDFTIPEIATTLGCPAATVQTRCYRAHQALKRAMEMRQ